MIIGYKGDWTRRDGLEGLSMFEQSERVSVQCQQFVTGDFWILQGK